MDAVTEIGWSGLELDARRELWSVPVGERERRLLRAGARAGRWDEGEEVRSRLGEFARNATDSVGLAQVRGLVDPARPERETTEVLSFLLGDFGRIVPQNGRGDLVSVLRDRGGDGASELGLHCDTCDLLVLLCLRPAFDGGGLTRLASARHVHDLIQRERPDALATLREDWTFDRSGRAGPQLVVTPILYDRKDGTIGCYYQTRTVRSSPDRGGPELTDRQWEALGVLDEVLYRPETVFGLPMAAGDLLIVRNSRVLHGRSPFVDEPGRYSRRMLRVWLNEGEEWAR
nr:TauD/TfdA family dioxygenase [Kitasatospora sp. Xyl93]